MNLAALVLPIPTPPVNPTRIMNDQGTAGSTKMRSAALMLLPGSNSLQAPQTPKIAGFSMLKRRKRRAPVRSESAPGSRRAHPIKPAVEGHRVGVLENHHSKRHDVCHDRRPRAIDLRGCVDNADAARLTRDQGLEVAAPLRSGGQPGRLRADSEDRAHNRGGIVAGVEVWLAGRNHRSVSNRTGGAWLHRKTDELPRPVGERAEAARNDVADSSAAGRQIGHDRARRDDVGYEHVICDGRAIVSHSQRICY